MVATLEAYDVAAASGLAGDAQGEVDGFGSEEGGAGGGGSGGGGNEGGE